MERQNAVARDARETLEPMLSKGGKSPAVTQCDNHSPFTTEAADRNRDGRVSVTEAFEYARSKVTQAYQQKGLLLTEHAALEDGHEGDFASTLFLQSPRARAAAAAAATTDPALRSLLEQKQALEDQVAALKLRKTGMDPAEYDRALEKLVTELALKTRAIQQLEGKKP